MPQLLDMARALDLADPLPGEVEVLADLFEGPGIAPVQAEP